MGTVIQLPYHALRPLLVVAVQKQLLPSLGINSFGLRRFFSARKAGSSGGAEALASAASDTGKQPSAGPPVDSLFALEVVAVDPLVCPHEWNGRFG